MLISAIRVWAMQKVSAKCFLEKHRSLMKVEDECFPAQADRSFVGFAFVLAMLCFSFVLIEDEAAAHARPFCLTSMIL